ncbi:NlpC/P60 family protein [Maribacter sp. 2304DJ31-5]|uniref:C40 family peptidase n=1 Tax=Maribacter sp. 2304DJ31-5 TaxID=3386273 RepID=UPI0039BD75AE
MESTIWPHIDSVKTAFAPDKRVALFAIEAKKEDERWILKGESNKPDAVLALRKKLQAKEIDFLDSIKLLPPAELMGRVNGLINVSVANLRSDPRHSAELATQAILGTAVKVLKQEGDWFYIQTPDQYLAWIDAGGIVFLDDQNFNQWQRSNKIIYTNTYGHAFLRPDGEGRVSDLVAGSVLETLEQGDQYYKVQFPDGRQGYVSKNESEEYGHWLDNLDPAAEALVATSGTLMGVPYLWGGTSTKGVDCSGFTKTIYFLNGMVIPRDASQQVHIGIPIDSVGNFENLEKGDLLFFGRKATDTTAEKVVHVGMWIGNDQFIHSSERVRISSMDENAGNFDAFNKNRYLRTQRVHHQDKGVMNLKDSMWFKN